MASMYGISKVSEITPHLLLTSVYGATRDMIIRNNVTLLVNCAQELPKQDIQGVESIKLFLDDVPYAIINVYFDRIADRIHEHATRGGRTAIHCVCGISRAASITIAYLMKYQQMTLRDAYEYVLARRSVIRPNQGFWRQLIDYEKRLNNNFKRQTAAAVAASAKTQKEIQIPIQIISSSSTPGYPTQPFIRSNSVRGLSNANNYENTNNYTPKYGNTYTLSNYTVPAEPITSDNKYSSSNCNHSQYKNEIGPYTQPRASSISRLSNSNAFIPTRNEYTTYESTMSKTYHYPNGKHRTSLFLDSFNDPKYSSIRPSSYSTVYRSDRF